MDFMYDGLRDGRTIRAFNVIDDYDREGLGVEVGFSMPAQRVIRRLEQIIEWRGKPAALRCDNGPEYISQALVAWANDHRITLIYIQPGNPRRMPITSDSIIPCGMNGLTCIRSFRWIIPKT